MVSSLVACALFVLFGTAVASPVGPSRLSKRYAVLSGQWDSESEDDGKYTLFNDLWNEATATSGSQTTQATDVSGDTVSWETTYSWEGASTQVKSYANLGLDEGLGVEISAITSIPVVWDWTYTSASDDLVADVSYDAWLATTSTPQTSSSDNTYEIMIWLSSRGGAGPAGSEIATVTVGGYSWTLYQGTVSTWTVYSFVTAQGEITSFSADLLDFLTYLVDSQGVSDSNYFSGLGAGTEPFVGSATLTTTAASMTVNS